MTQFVPFADGVEVSSQVLRAFVDGFPQGLKEQGVRVLKTHGLELGEGERFFSLEVFLKSMKQIQGSMGPDILYFIGKRIAHNSILPPGIVSIESALQSIDVAYHMNHRGGEIGVYKDSPLEGDGLMERGVLECRNPYPCAFDKGVIEGFAERFQANATSEILVREQEGGCRKKGDDTCYYNVSWR